MKTILFKFVILLIAVTLNSDTIAQVSEYSPFGFHPAGILFGKKRDYTCAQDIGVKWVRDGVYAFWNLVDPKLDGSFDFNGFIDSKKNYISYDEQWSTIPNEMHILANISDEHLIPLIHANQDKYFDFVYRLVERYDGDENLGCILNNGVDCYKKGDGQYPSQKVITALKVNPIKYWQVGNKVGKDTSFAMVQRITYNAIKLADSSAKVLMGGDGGNYLEIFKALNGKYIDIMDVHFFGFADGDYKGGKHSAVENMRKWLTQAHYPNDIPLWVTETGTYSGTPGGYDGRPEKISFEYQSEQQQASDLLRRYVWLLSQGAGKIFWAYGLAEGYGPADNDFWDNTGLIYDGQPPFKVGGLPNDMGKKVKKLSYYTYKLMTQKLEGSDWRFIKEIYAQDNVFIYSFIRNGKTFYTAWWDYWKEPELKSKTVSFKMEDCNSVTITQAVPNAKTGLEIDSKEYRKFFSKKIKTVVNNRLMLTLERNPVFIEK